MFKKSLPILLLIASTIGCRPEKEIAGADSYYPIKSGKSSVFEVTKTFYSITAPPRVTQHTIQHTIGESYTDPAGQNVFPVTYASRTNDLVWKADSVTAVWQTQNLVMGLENGQTIVKMHLPLQERSVWDGNAYNSLGQRRFEIINLGKPRQVGTVTFPNTVTIVRQNDSTLLSQKKHIEVYAEGVGLIRKEIIYINFCYSTDCKPGTIQSGWQEINVIKTQMQ
ncbi:hypothetical protein [Dyadobacter sp. 32]|uniref:hypothetical protein n=1 Tax=Dyadobacter sp. 32 TaxID=538966 RepID=UPI0011EF9998